MLIFSQRYSRVFFPVKLKALLHIIGHYFANSADRVDAMGSRKVSTYEFWILQNKKKHLSQTFNWSLQIFC